MLVFLLLAGSGSTVLSRSARPSCAKTASPATLRGSAARASLRERDRDAHSAYDGARRRAGAQAAERLRAAKRGRSWGLAPPWPRPARDGSRWQPGYGHQRDGRLVCAETCAAHASVTCASPRERVAENYGEHYLHPEAPGESSKPAWGDKVVARPLRRAPRHKRIQGQGTDWNVKSI